MFMKTNKENESALSLLARKLVAPGKGILAADESTPTIKRRFETIKVESTEENRRDYRATLFSTPKLSEFISGVILFDETLRQRDANGQPLIELLTRQDMIPGIKVDKGAKAPRNLNAINARGGQPWELGFSCGRALQTPALTAWAGQPENVSAAQKALYHRARCNGAARFGNYSAELEES